MAKPAAGEGLQGLFGAYASDDDLASGSEEADKAAGEGDGVVLVSYSAPGEEPDTPSAAAAVGALLASRNSAPDVDEAAQAQAEAEVAPATDLPAETEADPAADPDLQLPPELQRPPDKPVKDGLQATVVKYLRLKQSGSTISQAFKNHRDYTNPVFLEKMIGFFEIEQYGTCFDPAIFDPKSLPREDYYDRIAAEQNKRSQPEPRRPGAPVEFVSSRPSPPTATSAAAIVASARAAAQSSKRTKWDTQTDR